MKIDTLPTYQEICEGLVKKKRQKHLLFGNGFSMSYNSGIFSYNALSNFIENTDNDLLKRLFANLNTKNFELIMQQLDNFAEIAAIFSSDTELVSKIRNASEQLKSSLIDAVKELHPGHVFTIPEEDCKACYTFLGDYLSKGGVIFSTNYDLLPYWVLMRNNMELSVDGFGRDAECDTSEYTPEDERQYSELRWGRNESGQNICYLHGSLLIFDTGTEVVKEEYDGKNFLIENIKARMENQEYPIFVTAGNAMEKLTHISHNKYLSYCYERLCSISGSLVTFGFNFGEYDTHIIDAINMASRSKRLGDRLWSIYIGVYSDSDLEHIEKLVQQKKIRCKVNIYNARTANIWGR